MSGHEDVEFKALDGTVLRGVIYPAQKRGPGIIMTPGFTLTIQDYFFCDWAAFFQREGITALAYDPRGFGRSEGSPRFEVDPMMNVCDYHDALTFLKSHPMVNSKQIIFWGNSFSGMVALTAAALDNRVGAVIAINPVSHMDVALKEKWPATLSRITRDRESQLKGNPPYTLRVIGDVSQDTIGIAAEFVTDEAREYLERARDVFSEYEVPQLTLQSYYKIFAWRPIALMAHVSPTPVLIISGENDETSPLRFQKEFIFEKLDEPKAMHVIENKSHWDLLAADMLPQVMNLMFDFIKNYITNEKKF
ncbi:DltD N-terminal domain protein [Trichoderma camerunense]